VCEQVKSRFKRCERSRRCAAEYPDRRHRRLLRAHPKRPRRRTAEERDELTAFHARAHSITSSAAEGSGRLEVDNQLVFCRRLHRQVGRLLALEDAIDVTGRAAPLVNPIWPIGDKAAAGDEEPIGVDRG